MGAYETNTCIEHEEDIAYTAKSAARWSTGW